MYSIYNPLHVSNNFIYKGIIEGIDISPMKLQKLLYFLYRDYLKTTKNPLFSERFEAWKYGPVLTCVYEAFKKYGAKDIKTYYTDSNMRAYKINEASNPDFNKILSEVWAKYKNYNGIELSNITHQFGTAWHKAWVKNKLFLSDENIIAEEVKLLTLGTEDRKNDAPFDTEPIQTTRPIERPKKEQDVPPLKSKTHEDELASLTPEQKRDWMKWNKNLNFITFIMGLMFGLYISELVISISAPDVNPRLLEPLFDVLKTLMFTVAGFVFAKKTDE